MVRMFPYLGPHFLHFEKEEEKIPTLHLHEDETTKLIAFVLGRVVRSVWGVPDQSSPSFWKFLIRANPPFAQVAALD